jgi:hypothetical protein
MEPARRLNHTAPPEFTPATPPAALDIETLGAQAEVARALAVVMVRGYTDSDDDDRARRLKTQHITGIKTQTNRRLLGGRKATTSECVLKFTKNSLFSEVKD